MSPPQNARWLPDHPSDQYCSSLSTLRACGMDCPAPANLSRTCGRGHCSLVTVVPPHLRAPCCSVCRVLTSRPPFVAHAPSPLPSRPTLSRMHKSKLNMRSTDKGHAATPFMHMVCSTKPSFTCPHAQSAPRCTPDTPVRVLLLPPFPCVCHAARHTLVATTLSESGHPTERATTTEI